MPHGRPKLRSRLHSCHAQEGGPRSPQRTRGGVGGGKLKYQNQWKNVITIMWTSNLKSKEIRFIAVRMCLYCLGGVHRGFSWQFSVWETVLCYGLYSKLSVWFTIQSITQHTKLESYDTPPILGTEILSVCMHVSAVYFFVRVEAGYFCARIIFQDFPSSKNETILLFLEYKHKCVYKVCQMCPLKT